jgi:FKBP-type peptidyl-prolyl cis-trans isomerase (trigger factor)
MYYYTSERSVYEAYAAQYGVSYDDLLAQMGASDAMLMEYVNARVKEELIFYSIVKTEGIEVTDEDYAAGLAQYAADQGVTETELVEQYGEAYIRECILWDKLMVYLALQTTFTK